MHDQRTDDGRSVPIHHIRPEEPRVVDGPLVVTFFGARGVVIDSDSKAALAKESHDPATGRRRYWVKAVKSGPDRGRLYNPQSPTFSPRNEYEFREVKADAFDLFMRFLRTGNPLNVRGAERCI
jgi:hypothetical protein